MSDTKATEMTAAAGSAHAALPIPPTKEEVESAGEAAGEAAGGIVGTEDGVSDYDSDDGTDNTDQTDHMESVKRRQSLTHHAKTMGNDIRRGDIWKLCYDIANLYIFWFVVSALIIAEPILVSWNPYDHPDVIYIASGILTASTVCLGIQLAGRTYELFQDEENFRVEKAKMSKLENNKEMKLKTDEVQVKEKLSIFFRKVVFSGSFVLEASTLSLGWICLYTWPGIGTLRCFRAFRLLWFHELPHEVLVPLKHTLGKIFFLFGGVDFVELVFKVMKFATVTLSHLGQEMLCLTKKSRGGFILMFMLFYIAYVLGTTLWVETINTDLGEADQFCVDVLSCTYTMLRLTFFDGNGFDFAFSLVESKKHKLLFCVCVLYFFRNRERIDWCFRRYFQG